MSRPIHENRPGPREFLYLEFGLCISIGDSSHYGAAGVSTKENPLLAYATGSAGLAITVRGSSRRIKIMRFRPANIRLINRRSKLLRLLLALSSKNDETNDTNKPAECVG